jgi:hypothetical protein
VAHLKICSTDNFSTNGACWSECATNIHVGPTRRVVDKISCLIHGAFIICATHILPFSGAYQNICAIDNMWAPPGPYWPDLCQGYVWRIYQYAPLITQISMAHIEYAPLITCGSHTSKKVADLSVAHFLQYAPLIRSPRSISWQPHHHHFILLHLTPN